jgi:CelD/BcsL family acetyltransferase involved in cellulose biosynthesis
MSPPAVDPASGRAGAGATAPGSTGVRLEAPTPPTVREWERLCEVTDAPPFSRPGWTVAWSRVFQAGRLPDLLTARRDGDLVAALPVLRAGGVLRVATHSETPVLEPAALDEPAVRALVEGALDGPGRVVEWGPLWSGGAVARALRGAAAARRAPLFEEVLGSSPSVRVGAGSPAPAAHRSARSRREAGRKWRALERLGSVSFEVSDGRADDLEALLAEGFDVEIDGWKGREGTAVAAQSRVRRLYDEVAAWATAEDALRLAFLRVDGRAAAFAYLVTSGSRAYGLKMGFREEYARHSPGKLLVDRVLAWTHAEPGLERFEMLGTDDPYKRARADAVSDRVRLTVSTGRWTAPLDHLAARARVRARRELRDRVGARAWGRLSRVRGRVAGLVRD